MNQTTTHTPNRRIGKATSLRNPIRTVVFGALMLAALTGCNAAPGGIGAQGFGPAAILETNTAAASVTGVSVSYAAQLGGSATIELLDTNNNMIESIEISGSDAAVFEGLSAGTYFVVASETTGTIEPTAGVALSSSLMMMSDAVGVTAGQMTTVTCTTQGCN